MSVNLINTLAQPLKSAAKFVAYQEQSSGLSTSRCIMDTATCLGPKAICSRSKEDLFENSALEISENALVYYGPALVGEKIARKVFSKNLSNEAKSLVSTQAKELLESKNPLNKKVIPVKAAIALTALLIPFTEFTLNYFKNLATLKVFKKADFNNIASLEHKKEDKTIQDKVQKSAYKNIMKAVGAFLTALSVAGLVYKKGESSKFLMGLSEAILAPGTKFFKNNQKLNENLTSSRFSKISDDINSKITASMEERLAKQGAIERVAYDSTYGDEAQRLLTSKMKELECERDKIQEVYNARKKDIAKSNVNSADGIIPITMTIGQMRFSTRTHNILFNNGITTAKQLCNLTENQLRRFKGMGTAGINEIKERLLIAQQVIKDEMSPMEILEELQEYDAKIFELYRKIEAHKGKHQEEFDIACQNILDENIFDPNQTISQSRGKLAQLRLEREDKMREQDRLDLEIQVQNDLDAKLSKLILENQPRIDTQK